MRRLLPVIIIAALALTLVPLALAGGQGGGGWKHGKAKFNLVGTVTAVDAAEGTVTIKVKSGTKTVRAFRGKEPTMNVAAAAKIRLLAEDEAVAIPLADVPVGRQGQSARHHRPHGSGCAGLHRARPEGEGASGAGGVAKGTRPAGSWRRAASRGRRSGSRGEPLRRPLASSARRPSLDVP